MLRAFTIVYIVLIIVSYSCCASLLDHTTEQQTQSWTEQIKNKLSNDAISDKQSLEKLTQTYHLDLERIRSIPLPNRATIQSQSNRDEYEHSGDSSSSSSSNSNLVSTRKSPTKATRKTDATRSKSDYAQKYKSMINSIETRDWLIAHKAIETGQVSPSQSEQQAQERAEGGSVGPGAGGEPERRSRLPAGVNRPSHSLCTGFQPDNRLVKLVMTDLLVSPSTVNDRSQVIIKKRSRMRILVKAEIKSGLIVKGRITSSLFRNSNGFEEEVDTRTYSLCQKLKKGSCPLKMDKIEIEIEELVPGLLPSASYILRSKVYVNEQETAVSCSEFPLVIMN